MEETFKNRLVKAMQIRDIKAAELARKTGLNKSQISHYLRGTYEASQSALYKLAVALDVSEAWLMGCDTEMKRIINPENYENLKEVMLIRYGKDALELLALYEKLNKKGRKKAAELLTDLTKITDYIIRDAE